MIKRHPFLLFLAVTGAMIAAVILFIQSPQFAKIFKKSVAQYVPADLGIEGDFSEFAVKLFPPGISIRNPKIALKKKNVLNLPENSRVSAERLDLVFLPFQMLTGDIRVHQVSVVKGDVQIDFNREFLSRKPQKKESKLALHWDDLFQVRADSVVLEDTKLKIAVENPRIEADVTAKYLQLGQVSTKAGMGYRATVELSQIHGKLPQEWHLPDGLDQIQASVFVNPSGLKMDDLTLIKDGLEAHLKGQIRGNLLEPKGLLADAECRLKGDLEKIAATVFGVKDVKGLPQGAVDFKGKIKGNLDRLRETVRAEGALELKDAHYQSWQADLAQIEGTWNSAPGGGDLAVTKAVIQAAERERVGGRQSAHGGKITVGEFKVRLGANDPVTIPVTLDRAHIHWLGAPALKSVYPLNFRVSGPLTTTFTPKSGKNSWQLASQLNLSIDRFQLDNQRLGKDKPMHRILDIPKLAIKGGVLIDDTGIRPDGLQATLVQSKMNVGGKIDFKTGYQLVGSGDVNLEELSEIAENKIRGKGNLNVSVHGPSSNVFIDFEGDLKDAYYLHLNLGDLKGKITWDDDPSDLLFSKVQVRKGGTPYVVDGKLALGDKEFIALDVQLPEGRIEDFSSVFDDLTQDLWWYPHRLFGPMRGKLRVSGGIGLDLLKVDADIHGEGWDYFGERFRSVQAKGGYDRGKYFIESLHAIKRNGEINGRISFDTDRRFDWDFRTNEFTLNDLDRIARLDVPMRGNLSIKSVGQGKLGDVESKTEAHLTDFAVRGVGTPSSDWLIQSSRGIMHVKSTALGGQGTLDMNYNFQEGAPCQVKMRLNRLDFTPVLLLINPKNIQDTSLTAYASGSVDLNFASGALDRASGNLSLSEYLLSKSGSRFELDSPVSLRVDRGTFDLDSIQIRGMQGISRLTLRGRDGNLTGAIDGDLDANLSEYFTSVISQVAGIARLNLGITGTIKKPLVNGKVGFESVSARIPSLDAAIENIRGGISVRQGLLTLQGIEGDLAQGRVSASGIIDLYLDRYPILDLKAGLSGNKLKIFPFQYAKVRGTLRASGDTLPYLVDGSVHIDSALSKESLFKQTQMRGLKSARYLPPPTTRQESDYPLFKLNINASAERGILAQNELFDVEMKGQLTVVNTLEAPRILGTAEVIHGTMSFKDRVFQIQSAAATFDNPSAINPKFNLSANTEVSGKKIQMFISGRLDSYKVDLSSNPPLTEPEILSLLVVGLTSDDVRKLRTGDRGAVQQTEAASILLHSLDFNRDIQSKTGLQIQLDEASGSTQKGTSIFDKRTDTDTAASPKIVIKRQIGNRLELSVGSTVGVGSNNQKEVNAEVKVTPGFSVIGVWDSLESSTTDTQDRQTSYGVDLKLQKRFK